jgi:hypothetical protein
MNNRILHILIVLALSPFAAGAETGIPNINAIYSATIKTVLLHKDGFELSAPIWWLNSEEKLKLSFDDLTDDLVHYKFTIRHCEADWTTTPDMLASEYISGQTEDEIRTFEYSFNTQTKYIHYSTLVPTPDLKPKISGNYLLIVYEEDPSAPAFTFRFMVAEPSVVTVEGEVTQPDAMADKYSGQQVNFRIQTEGSDITAPRLEVRPVILQNERWDNAIYCGKAPSLRGTELDYSYDARDVFNGGNEFRGFDLKSLRAQSTRIRRITFDTAIQVYLLDDVKRTTKNYVRDPDINGRRLIKSDDNVQKNETECDYAWVHFYLMYDAPVPNRHIYVYGALTNWMMTPQNELIYNPVARRYELTLFLKQGYYNYFYVTRDEGSSAGDETAVEGSHWETENQYLILVYVRPLSGWYDKLVATGEINSSTQ